MASPLSDWYLVRLDDKGVHRAVAPPGGQPWRDFFAWDDVVRVCLKLGDFLESDEFYVFTRQRRESYVIPTEANGGADLMGAFVERGLFDAQLAVDAALAGEGLYCWPEITDEEARRAGQG